MKANELMIGDWVYNTHNKKAERVAEIRENGVMLDYNDIYPYDEIEPIPIGADLLTSNGFKTHDATVYPIKGVLAIKPVECIYKDDWGYILLRAVGNEWNFLQVWYEKSAPTNCLMVAYVHELQHALKHCKVEKPIEL